MGEENSKVIRKGGRVKSLIANDEDMELINALALEPLEKSEVYTFEVVACDNDIDRDFERFDDEALKQLSELFVGRTVIKDHRATADNQFARVYDARVQDSGGETSDGRDLKQLVVKCYTLDCEANKQIISEIKAGIKKEVSVSFMPGSVTCSVCGTDRRKQWCEHRWGKEYEGVLCSFILGDIKDAYELSFVAIPAQRNAGTKKDYAFDEDDGQETPEEKSADAQAEHKQHEEELLEQMNMEIEIAMREFELGL